MRSVLGVLLLLGCLSGSQTASADSYSYGGSGKRFQLRVWLLGFNEGAGAEGWDEDSARDFAGWASRFDAIVPTGAFVSLTRDVNDSETTLTIRVGKRSERHRIADVPGFEPALRIVARRFQAQVPKARRQRIYTLQLLATRSEASARRFAERLEAREVRAEGQLYYAACHPCDIPESKVLEPKGGVYRVVTGVFGDQERAKRALRVLERRWKLRGFVREL